MYRWYSLIPLLALLAGCGGSRMEAPEMEPVSPTLAAIPNAEASSGPWPSLVGDAASLASSSNERPRTTLVSSSAAAIASLSSSNTTPLFGSAWLLAQPQQNYTLRIMSARAAASVQALRQRYPGLKEPIAYTDTNPPPHRYHVYYGTFTSLADAQQAASQLPAALGKPLPIPLSALQQELHATP